jgi:hypothetical protein
MHGKGLYTWTTFGNIFSEVWNAKEAPNQDGDYFIKTLKNRLRHNYEKMTMDMMNTQEKNKGQIN